MERRYFGTDGIRGKVGTFPITPDFVLKLGWAVGRVLANGGNNKVLIGKDTRISGYMFESALEAGLSAAGVDIHLLGPMPTPAIAYLTRTFRAKAGIVISASHNPFQDNGIKFFGATGTKLPDEVEACIEQQLDQPMNCVPSDQLGKAVRIEDAAGRYIEFCKSTIPSDLTFKGLKIVVDCANGATYHIAPNVFHELGAEVVEISVDPNGLNINEHCGAMYPEKLAKLVKLEQADLGIALDGDGDRLIMVDHKGEIVDGDELLFVIANYLVTHSQFKGGVVGTQMSNLGLELAFKKMGIEFARTAVGDRHISAELLTRGWILGGEASGHILHLGLHTTGDGIISALQVMMAMLKTGKSLHQLKSGMKKYPQELINVKTQKPIDLKQNSVLQKAVKSAEEKLADKGRVLLRSSGTESCIRVMVEGEDAKLVSTLANELADVVNKLTY
jgi:phosphoglucosamine mutase